MFFKTAQSSECKRMVFSIIFAFHTFATYRRGNLLTYTNIINKLHMFVNKLHVC